MQEKPFFPKLAGALCAGTAVGTPVCTSYGKIGLGEGFGDQEIIRGWPNEGWGSSALSFQGSHQGFLTGRPAKVKGVLLQHLIRKGPLSLCLQLVLEW